MQRLCKHHGITEFFNDSPKHWKCKKCNVEGVIARRRQNKIELINFFGGQCVVCGYSKCIWALEFHHTEPAHKDFGLGKYGSRSLKRLIEEAKKCILVCCRCHREIHEEEHSIEKEIILP
jgi:rubredoxin